MFAHFLLPEGTGGAQIPPTAVDLSSILTVENRAGALREMPALRSELEKALGEIISSEEGMRFQG